MDNINCGVTVSVSVLILTIFAVPVETQDVSCSGRQGEHNGVLSSYHVACGVHATCLYRRPLHNYCRTNRTLCLSGDPCRLNTCEINNQLDNDGRPLECEGLGINRCDLFRLYKLLLCDEYFSSSNLSLTSMTAENPLGFVDIEVTSTFGENQENAELFPLNLYFREIDILVSNDSVSVRVFQFPLNDSQEDLRCWWSKQVVSVKDLNVKWSHDHKPSSGKIPVKGFTRPLKNRNDVIVRRDKTSMEITIESCFESFSNFAVAAIYMSVVFSFLSLLASLIVITLHFKFKQLRNVYGFCIVGLSVTIASSDACFLVRMLLLSLGRDALATTVFIHYIWLSIFSWETVTIFQVYCSLRSMGMVNSMSRDPGDTQRKVTMAIYAAIGWGAGLPFVASGLLCHFLETVPFKYGNHWLLGRQYITLLIFCIPASCLVAGGMLLMALILLKLFQMRTNGKANNLDNRRHLIYAVVRLKVTLCLPWAVFITTNFTTSPRLIPLIFSVTSCQGFVMLMSLASTKRVRSIIKESWRRKIQIGVRQDTELVMF